MNALFSILLSLTALGAQPNTELYYQYDYALHVGTDKYVVKVDHGKYALYHGIVSPDGQYVCGLLYDDDLRQLTWEWKTGGITETPPPSNMIFVVQRVKDSAIVFRQDSISTFLDVSFSPGSNLLLVNDATPTLVDLSKGQQSPVEIGPLHSYKWYDDALYYVAFTKEGTRFSRYDFSDASGSDVFFMPVSSFGDRDWLQLRILDTLTLAGTRRIGSSTEVFVIGDGSIEFSERWSTARCVGTAGTTAYVFGIRDSQSGTIPPALFALDCRSNTFKQLFTVIELNDKVSSEPWLYTGIRFVFPADGVLYILVSSLLDVPNLLALDLKSGEFEAVVDRGPVYEPTGVFSKRE
jgi:hypothetical protein